jgi:pseudouridine-5'-phosphate glycosidase
MSDTVAPWLTLHPEISSALAAGRPVVALESTVITHGLPRPVNLELARRMESEVRAGGAVPATAAVLRGEIRLGLAPDELELLAMASPVRKVSVRDLGLARARQEWGGTTVAATMRIAHAAGVRIFATGGIGGVHRGDAADVSADLPELQRTPVAVVCSGAKSILDLPRTLEWLETSSVPVLGWQTSEFPAFFTRTSGLAIDARCDTIDDVVAILRAHWGSGVPSGVLVCVPCPPESEVPGPVVETALEAALALAASRGIGGKAVTPFLLEQISLATDGATLRANLALLRNNARLAAAIACRLAG